MYKLGLLVFLKGAALVGFGKGLGIGVYRLWLRSIYLELYATYNEDFLKNPDDQSLMPYAHCKARIVQAYEEDINQLIPLLQVFWVFLVCK